MIINGITHIKVIGPIIITVCCCCQKLLNIKSACGEEGAISDDYCQPCFDKIEYKKE